MYDVHVTSYATFLIRRFFLTSVYNVFTINEKTIIDSNDAKCNNFCESLRPVKVTSPILLYQ